MLDFVFNLASTNINQSEPNLVKMNTTIRSRMSLIMDVIKLELSKLYALEFENLPFLTLFTLMIEWCFTPLLTVFQSYHRDNSHYSCFPGFTRTRLGSEVSCPRTLPRKNPEDLVRLELRTPGLRVKHLTTEPRRTLIYTQASANVNQSAPNLVTICMTIRSRMTSCMVIIGPDRPELFVLELEKNCHI